MENINAFREYLAELCKQLDGSRFDQINFDEMAQKLSDMGDLLTKCQVHTQELETLRESTRSR